MRLSRYFLPILRETPKEAEIVSHRLMLRAGMIRQESAGIYAWLPLGLKVLNNINRIIREEQNRAGAVECLMPTIQSADLWRESGRYEAYGKEMLRISDRHEREMLYGPTNEEMITEIFRAYVRSYKDLPLNLYHIQWKFRDEVRPRFGVMRSREFLMKDAYSFDLTAEASRHSYNKMFVAYLRTFARMGLTAIPMAADTGPIGGNLSHEFIILADTGESEVYCHKDYLTFAAPPADVDFDDPAALAQIVGKWTSRYAATSEMHDASAFAAVPEDAKLSARGIEVGHIFYFGTKYSEPMKAVVNGPDGKEVAVQMGSYGIGPSRLVAAIIEAFHDDAGVVWPETVAPFHVGVADLKVGDAATGKVCGELVEKLENAGLDVLHDDAGVVWPETVAPFHVGVADLKVGDAATGKVCGELVEKLENAGLDVLHDDRDERPGAKFATLDLIGLPWQILVGPKGLADGRVEVKRRKTGERELLSPDEAAARVIEAVKQAGA